MPTTYQALFPDTFLVKHWADEYRRFRGSQVEDDLLKRLHDWANKRFQKETVAEGAFVDGFFKRLWGYRAAGDGVQTEGYTCEPRFKVGHAGQGGGIGIADLALGWFDRAGIASTPQVLCEFKDVRSGLDKPQSRKGNDRSPVKQCADYLREVARPLYGNESIQPTWGLVSDMNEFRLYWRKKMPAQYQRFLLKPISGEATVSLISSGEDAAFQRFVFWRIFQPDLLLSSGGPSALEKLLTEQWGQERAIEKDFYREYQAYRTRVFNTLVDANPDFKGTRGRLVRLTQRFLDRCIFVLFCEDMGLALNFPPNVLRDVLVGVSNDPDYEASDDAAWLKVRKLFAAMRDGSPFRTHRINRFNGGLFAPEPDLESLHIPTSLFCAKGQGANAESLVGQKETLLFFSANYNFGVTGGTFERSVGLYTLGHIFEQSITELEFMEAKAEGRASITELSKRKRDGVYYTPEWITSYIVEETVGAHLAEIRLRLGLDPLPTFSDEELAHYQRARASGKKDKRYNTERAEKYMDSLDRFGSELEGVKVVDPACGSGAFLIQALDRLVNERRWLAGERERVTGKATMFDSDTVTKAVLSQNIYGVDINEESIEITRLALWLHTALPDRPLSSLDNNIRCGNSLIGPDFYLYKQGDLFTVEQRERINTFDWEKAFPEVLTRPSEKAGFDCVIGNPPYVKLQHFKKVQPDVADYLLNAGRDEASGPLYASTQTQNFDMYLPFIERGIRLLNAGGRMGFIAPNVWLVNEYGEALRNSLRESRHLERWVDFKDFPVFEEAMTYTALQFFRGKPSAGIRCAFAPKGSVDLGAIEWSHPDAVVDYAALPADEAWVFLPRNEQEFLDALTERCRRLDSIASGIVVGIQTSADHIYHLEKLGPGRYQYFPKGMDPIEVPIEDGLMRPLISGEEAKRFLAPQTRTYLLFPYDDVAMPPALFSRSEMQRRFPAGWNYLRSHELELRARENGKMDREDQWWGYNYPKNIDKQRLPKLGVAQTVPGMRVFYDSEGSFCFNNVRVNGILSEKNNIALFLLGILNCRVVDFVFRRRSKSKEPRPSGAYFEANKQYIAPLPIPHATDSEMQRIGEMARELQRMHSLRRDTIVALDQRLASKQLVADPRPHKWFWADVGDVAYWTKLNPDDLRGRALATWAKDHFENRLKARYDEISQAMSFGATMCADCRNGELKFFVRDRCVVSGVYVGDREAPVILAQWRQMARDLFVSETVNAEKVVTGLLNLKRTENDALISQIDRLNRDLERVEAEIRSAERELDDAAYNLYHLSDLERVMVETDTRTRWDTRIPIPPISVP